MRTVTFLVLEGVDKGRVYKDLPIPVTIGREEGNGLRLNDERVSRFHAKVQVEDNDIILTDLDSTNGTRVNGTAIQIRRLRAGDQVAIGRTMLLFGTMEEIAARRATAVPASERRRRPRPSGPTNWPPRPDGGVVAQRQRANGRRRRSAQLEPPSTTTFRRCRMKLSPAQAARLAEIFDYLHRGLTTAVENIDANEDGTEIRLGFGEWQTIQAVQMLLARYGRSIAEPDAKG